MISRFFFFLSAFAAIYKEDQQRKVIFDEKTHLCMHGAAATQLIFRVRCFGGDYCKLKTSSDQFD